MALESFPPLLLVGTRFTISGTIMLLATRLAKLPLPGRRDTLYSVVFGLMALGIGNSCLTYSELLIPSGLAALFVTTSPFWMTGLEAAQLGGERLRPLTILGLLIGLFGTGILIGPSWQAGFSGDVIKGFLILQFGCFSWSLSSILQRRRIAHVNAAVSGAIQQLAAGVGFLLAALLVPEHAVQWSIRGVGAMLYLVLFGSIVGYTSYVYVLRKLPVALITIHVYINPLVAVGLGWLIFREPFGSREAIAMAIIFLGVAVVKKSSSPRNLKTPPASSAVITKESERVSVVIPSREPLRPLLHRESEEE